MKHTGKLTAKAAHDLIAAGAPGKHGDGQGVWLQIGGPGRASWLLRYASPATGKAREMGLGAARAASVAEAAASLQETRAKAVQARELLRQGSDPLEARKAAQAPVQAAAKGTPFRQAAEAYMTTYGPSWRNPAHRKQWASTLRDYVYPTLGDRDVASITPDDVLAVLAPIWTSKSETAGRTRGRIEIVLNYSSVRGWRPRGPNPAAWRGHLQFALPARNKVAPVQHHPAMPWTELPAFMRRLEQADGVAALCLRWTILTACRSGESRGATWDEIDRGKTVWSIGADRMKGGRDHEVPVCAAALAVLDLAAVVKQHDPALIFPGMALDRPMSDATMSALLRRLGCADVTVHGFRSSFRDWCGEATSYPRELAEQALAHALADRTEAAYARSTLLERRRPMMADWGAYLVPGGQDSRVVPIRGTRPVA